MLSQFGKQVADKCYVHVSAIGELELGVQELIGYAAKIAELNVGHDFNVVRIRDSLAEVALLDYPNFLSEAFPTLARSWRVHVPAQIVRFRDYSSSLNPPILHRKELLLPEKHPEHAKFSAVTAVAQSLGLFDEPHQIGFKSQWLDLLQRRGYVMVGHEFLPIGNAEPTEDNLASFRDDALQVYRHLTALSRTSLSAPIQSLLRDELLTPSTTFFDYGCGKGDDLRGLKELEIPGSGWDPYHRPDAARIEADVVNLGFVINVIEDFDERIQALLNAFALCRHVLAVSVMLEGSGKPGRPFRDGILTTRNTFQKYYTQAQLQQFLESVLDEEAHSAAPGVFYVFCDRAEEERFLLRRYNTRGRLARAILPRPAYVAVRSHRTAAAAIPNDPELQAFSSKLWQQCLALGRSPEPDEVDDLNLITGKFGSLSKAIRHCLKHNAKDALERAARCRRDDILVALAAARFSKRKRFQDLERQLQRDVKALFGSLVNAEREAQSLLFSVANSDALNEACRQAAEIGLGHLEPEHSLQLHSSMVERLPAILRVYVGCATALFGDVRTIDLVKLHISSGKVTLMRFNDFVNQPIPAMTERIKVRLKDQDLDLFRYGDEHPEPLLYGKSRFINEEFPHYAEQVAFEEMLDSLSIVDLSGYGPPASEFKETLARARWCINGFQLERSKELPELDAQCSRSFKFRELIEVGSTWQRTRVENLPRSADSFTALADLARFVLDPVVDYFGRIEITHGFCSSVLAREIQRGIEPRLDQHSAYEVNRRGRRICHRGGAAIDFLVRDEDMLEVAEWIGDHLPFDRMYYYGRNRPLHVSLGPENRRELVEIGEINGRRVPRGRRTLLQNSRDRLDAPVIPD